ncbi:hypothetical protein Pcinc_033118 [Petrolisthes cinctipes]|uniref:UDP-N-acetylglucosamine transferase subunit ALG13 n=1 Tax=Petrolisthes cinctipes TaxID=88211 RepID=A0AAE1ET35_PETCI|nr:hypothetical protein Pcinc_033118 [Petrolisthes cinctipes]
MMCKTVFLTVGTTHFDTLVKAAVDEDTLAVLREKGYTKLVLQIGRGTFTPIEGEHCGVTVSSFHLKPSIAEDFQSADLVISHAGAGSCLEALRAGKALVVVVNDTLMDNHQTELAEELANNKFCYFCYPDTLQETLTNMDVSQLQPYVPGKPMLLARYLESVI